MYEAKQHKAPSSRIFEQKKRNDSLIQRYISFEPLQQLFVMSGLGSIILNQPSGICKLKNIMKELFGIEENLFDTKLSPFFGYEKNISFKTYESVSRFILKGYPENLKPLKLRIIPAFRVEILGKKASNTRKQDIAGKSETNLNDKKFLSRIAINKSCSISLDLEKGNITGLSKDFSFNFSVGIPDHAYYYSKSSGFSSSRIIVFYLKREQWKLWKLKYLQFQGGCFPCVEALSTLNDINMPGVKYEIKKKHVSSFFDNVVEKGIVSVFKETDFADLHELQIHRKNRMIKIYNKLFKKFEFAKKENVILKHYLKT